MSSSTSSKNPQSKNGSYKDNRNQSSQQKPGVSMDLQERTLRVSNYGRKVTESILRELFSQGGPVRKIVFKEQFSFIEFEDAESVSYCLALFDGVELFGDRLQLSPKITNPTTYDYMNTLKQYEQMFVHNPLQWWNRFGDPNKPCPSHICSYSPNAYNYPQNNYDLYHGNRMMVNSNINPMMITTNQMMMNNNSQMMMLNNGPFMNNQMMMPTCSNYTNFNDMGTMNKSRSMREFDNRISGSFNNRDDFGDRNNNEQQYRRNSSKYEQYSNKRSSNSKKRPQNNSPSRPVKKRKHQSF